MRFGNIICFMLSFLMLISCNNFESYKLDHLLNSSANSLQLPVEKNYTAEKYAQLFEKLKDLSKNDLIQQLQQVRPELHEVSYGLYYLANAYAADNEIDSAILCHKAAANQYLNPQSFLKMAEWYFYREKKFGLAYECLHQSLELTVEITQNNPQHPLAKNSKNKLQFLLSSLESAAKEAVFDKEKVRIILKEQLPKLLKQQQILYQLGGS